MSTKQVGDRIIANEHGQHGPHGHTEGHTAHLGQGARVLGLASTGSGSFDMMQKMMQLLSDVGWCWIVCCHVHLFGAVWHSISHIDFCSCLKISQVSQGVHSHKEDQAPPVQQLLIRVLAAAQLAQWYACAYIISYTYHMSWLERQTVLPLGEVVSGPINRPRRLPHQFQLSSELIDCQWTGESFPVPPTESAKKFACDFSDTLILGRFSEHFHPYPSCVVSNSMQSSATLSQERISIKSRRLLAGVAASEIIGSPAFMARVCFWGSSGSELTKVLKTLGNSSTMGSLA